MSAEKTRRIGSENVRFLRAATREARAFFRLATLLPLDLSRLGSARHTHRRRRGGARPRLARDRGRVASAAAQARGEGGRSSSTFTYGPAPACGKSRRRSRRSSKAFRAALVFTSSATASGGLAVRWFVQEMPHDARVVQTISVAAPFAGARGAWLLPGPAGRDMRAGSTTLRRLVETAAYAGIPHLSIFGTADTAVAADTTFPVGDRLVVPDAGHNMLLFDEAVVDRVVEAITTRKIGSASRGFSGASAMVPGARVSLRLSSLVALVPASLVLLLPARAHADVSSWLFVGGGVSGVFRPHVSGHGDAALQSTRVSVRLRRRPWSWAACSACRRTSGTGRTSARSCARRPAASRAAPGAARSTSARSCARGSPSPGYAGSIVLGAPWGSDPVARRRARRRRTHDAHRGARHRSRASHRASTSGTGWMPNPFPSPRDGNLVGLDRAERSTTSGRGPTSSGARSRRRGDCPRARDPRGPDRAGDDALRLERLDDAAALPPRTRTANSLKVGAAANAAE